MAKTPLVRAVIVFLEPDITHSLDVCSEIIMWNWVVNPTGRPNGFIPVDLLQEHLDFWIKVCASLSPYAIVLAI